MNLRELNEEIEKVLSINEISDELKDRYIAGRQAQLDAAQAKLDKARSQVKSSDIRQISAMPQGIDLDTAKDALEELKYEMRKVDRGDDWRGPNEEGDQLVLEVRYWGNWEGDDGSGDYDWQQLTDKSKDALDSIVRKVCKKYGVNIEVSPSEKNWIIASLDITKMHKDSKRTYNEDKIWQQFIDKNKAIDLTNYRRKTSNTRWILEFEAYNKYDDYRLTSYKVFLDKVSDDTYNIKYKKSWGAGGAYALVKQPSSLKDCLDAAQKFIDDRKAAKQNPRRKRSQDELFRDFLSDEYNIWGALKEVQTYYQAHYRQTWKDSLLLEYRYGVYGATAQCVELYKDGRYCLYINQEVGYPEKISYVEFEDEHKVEEGEISLDNGYKEALKEIIRKCNNKLREVKGL